MTELLRPFILSQVSIPCKVQDIAYWSPHRERQTCGQCNSFLVLYCGPSKTCHYMAEYNMMQLSLFDIYHIIVYQEPTILLAIYNTCMLFGALTSTLNV